MGATTRTRRFRAMISGGNKVLCVTLLRIRFPLGHRSITRFLVSRAPSLRCFEHYCRCTELSWIMYDMYLT